MAYTSRRFGAPRACCKISSRKRRMGSGVLRRLTRAPCHLTSAKLTAIVRSCCYTAQAGNAARKRTLHGVNWIAIGLLSAKWFDDFRTSAQLDKLCALPIESETASSPEPESGREFTRQECLRLN